MLGAAVADQDGVYEAKALFRGSASPDKNGDGLLSKVRDGFCATFVPFLAFWHTLGGGGAAAAVLPFNVVPF